MSEDNSAMTPSQRIISEASAPRVLTDSLGRKLTLRKLTSLDQLKLYRAIGAEQSTNQVVYWMSAAAAGVSHIDGIFMPFPKDERAIDDRMKRLGDEGIAVVIADQRRQVDAMSAEAAKAVADAEAAAADGEEAEMPSPVDPLA